jgi:hypothetical protein
MSKWLNLLTGGGRENENRNSGRFLKKKLEQADLVEIPFRFVSFNNIIS